jgi:hypothetical protein
VRPPEPDNAQLVGGAGDGMITITMPRRVMTREEALLQAAWIVEIAERDNGEFEEYREAVRAGKWPT